MPDAAGTSALGGHALRLRLMSFATSRNASTGPRSAAPTQFLRIEFATIAPPDAAASVMPKRLPEIRLPRICVSRDVLTLIPASVLSRRTLPSTEVSRAATAAIPEPTKSRIVKPWTVTSSTWRDTSPGHEVHVPDHADPVHRLGHRGGIEARVNGRRGQRQDHRTDASSREPVRLDRHVLAVRTEHEIVSPGSAASTAAWIDCPGPTTVARSACAGPASARTAIPSAGQTRRYSTAAG
jgi:hypothetical protein